MESHKSTSRAKVSSNNTASKKGKHSKLPKPQKTVRTIVSQLPFDVGNHELPRLLRVYGAHLERVRSVLGTQAAADARGPDALRGHVLYRAGLRTPLFMLQGLARVSLGTGGDEKVFGKLLQESKIIEDALGEVDWWWSLAEKGTTWGLPDTFLARVQERHRAASGRLIGWLEARSWIDHRYLPNEGEVKLRAHRIGRSLYDVSWPSSRKEHKELTKFLYDCARSIEEALPTLDLNDIEHGVHELRRKLRWISIYATALDGAVQLDHDAKPPKGYARYMTPAVLENPFNILPKGDGTAKPVVIPAPLFYALSWIIAELGSLKDRAQWTDAIAHGLDALDLSGGARPKRWMGDLALEHRDATKQAAALVERVLVEDKLLTRLAEALDAQRS